MNATMRLFYASCMNVNAIGCTGKISLLFERSVLLPNSIRHDYCTEIMVTLAYADLERRSYVPGETTKGAVILQTTKQGDNVACGYC